ncbi:hypothetical protein APHAL10511_008295 [Amanita phalloides]|nr:hypothetical protein APHAL10511_008295 [Amanita phalloides]
MSRGDRVPANGILSLAMRNNYGEYGVDETANTLTVLQKSGSNVSQSSLSWGETLYVLLAQQMVADGKRSSSFDQKRTQNYLIRPCLWSVSVGPYDYLDRIFCSGEVTMAFADWLKTGQNLHKASQSEISQKSVPQRKSRVPVISVGPDFPQPHLMAADPYTSEAFIQRTGLPCDALSFRDVAEGALPSSIIDHSRSVDGQTTDKSNPEVISSSSEDAKIEMVVCSFALHLIESSSELFALLWELSTKVRWLVVIAPHKKPEIKAGWGWVKWNLETWSESHQMSEIKGEFLHDRVHCRVYKSVNV